MSSEERRWTQVRVVRDPLITGGGALGSHISRCGVLDFPEHMWGGFSIT